MDRLDHAQLYHDTSSLDSLRQAAKGESKEEQRAALRQAAEQFESMFWSEILKNMRKSEDVLAEGSPFNSQSTRFYRDMQDQQMAVDMASKGTLGLSDLLLAQFDPDHSPLKPPESLSRDLNDRVARARETTAAQSTPVTPAESPEFSSPEEFTQRLLPHAKQAAQALGLEPLVLVAQAALETGWGQKVIKAPDGESSFNLFNIKADKRWQGEAVSVGTLEYKQGVPVKETAAFRKYQDFAQSFSDYVDFIKSNGRYRDARAAAGEPEQYLRELQNAGYATDPNYADKILGVLGSGVMQALGK